MIAGRIDLPCLIQDCDGAALGGRGLCNACYLEALRAIQRGETSWDELVRAKLAWPVDRRRPTKFKAALHKLKIAAQEATDENPR